MYTSRNLGIEIFAFLSVNKILRLPRASRREINSKKEPVRFIGALNQGHHKGAGHPFGALNQGRDKETSIWAKDCSDLI